MKTAQSLLIACGYILASTSSAADLRYDSQAAAQEQIFREYDIRAKFCMRDAVKVQLTIGKRDQDEIVSWATRSCGVLLQNFMVSQLKQSPAVVDAYLRSLAFNALQRTPGVELNR